MEGTVLKANTLTVKVKYGTTGEERPNGEKPVTVFYKCGDWAVTQGICPVHNNACYRVTHIPSTMAMR